MGELETNQDVMTSIQARGDEHLGCVNGEEETAGR
jgi:hypothetical protein